MWKGWDGQLRTDGLDRRASPGRGKASTAFPCRRGGPDFFTSSRGGGPIAIFGLVAILAGCHEAAPKPLDVLMQTLGKVESPEVQANILRGLNASLKGRRDIAVPAAWEALYGKLKASPSEEVRQQAQALAVTFGGESALAEMRRALGDRSGNAGVRQAALDSLIAARDLPALPLSLDLLKESTPLRAPALRGLAGFEDTKIPAAVLALLRRALAATTGTPKHR